MQQSQEDEPQKSGEAGETSSQVLEEIECCESMQSLHIMLVLIAEKSQNQIVMMMTEILILTRTVHDDDNQFTDLEGISEVQ